MVILLPKQQSKKHPDFTESDTHNKAQHHQGWNKNHPCKLTHLSLVILKWALQKSTAKLLLVRLGGFSFWIEESTCLVRHLKPFVAFANSTTDSTNPWAIPTASDVKQDPDLSELTECPDGIGKKTGSATRRDRDNAVISGRYLWEGARSVFIKHLIIWKRRKSGR